MLGSWFRPDRNPDELGFGRFSPVGSKRGKMQGIRCKEHLPKLSSWGTRTTLKVVVLSALKS